jgi:hypothetical protein
MPDDVNVIHANNRHQLAITGNPHLDEDSYVRERWPGPVTSASIAQCEIHLIGLAVFDICHGAVPDRKPQRACLPRGGSYRQAGGRMNGVTVLEMTDPRWAEFVETNPAATPFHHPDWTRVVAGCYGFRGFALVTHDATGAIPHWPAGGRGAPPA